MHRFSLFLSVFFLTAASLFLAACGKDEPEPDPYHLQCKIEGAQWTATKSVSGEYNSGTIIVNGVSQSDDTLRLLIQDQAPGSYPIKNISNICILKKDGTTYLPLNSADGELVILAHDEVNKVIEGSFHYTADGGAGNWLVITDGKFKAAYQ